MGFEATFEQFATSTVIRVFNFIRTSAFIAEKIFWIIVLICFSAATMWSVSGTIKTFLSEPTASQVSIVSNATSGGLVFPNAILCLHMIPGNLLKLYEPNIDAVIAKVTASSDLLGELKANLESVHERERRRSAAFKNLSTFGGNEEGPLREYHQFEGLTAGVFSDDDVALLALTSVMFFRLTDLEMNFKTKHLNWQSPAVKRLYEAYVGKQTNFDELFAITGEAVCVLFQIRIVTTYVDLQSTFSKHIPYTVCDQSATIFFGLSFAGMEMSCYRLRGDTPFVFKTSVDCVTLTMHSRTLYKHLASELGVIAIDLSGHFQGDRQLPFLAKFSQKQTIKFALETESTSLDLRRRPCSPKGTRKGTQTDCMYWCCIEQIVGGCACNPLMRQMVAPFGNLPDRLESCALKLDEEFRNPAGDSTCRSVLAQPYSTENCTQTCPPNCEIFMFSGPEVVVDQSLDFLNVTTAVKLRSAKFIYTEIVEYVTMDGKAFVASLGGNLSLYLGASFLALIHIIVFFVRLPFERKHQSGSTAPANANALAIKPLADKIAILEEQMKEIQKHKHRWSSTS